MDMSRQGALVTGATGKIGRHLVNRLVACGFRVKALTRSGDNPWRGIENIEIVRGDVLNAAVLAEAIKGCDYIFHLAVHQDITDRKKDLFQQVNVTGTKVILGCALNTGIKNILYVSTAMVFEPTGKVERGENWPKRSSGSDHYLKTKIEALEVVNQMKKLLPITVVYPTAVIDLKGFSSSSPVNSGGLQKFLWEKIGMGVPGGFVNLIGSKKRIFNYVIVEDLVEGIIKASINGTAGEEYILGGENISAEEYLTAACRRVNKKPFPVRIPFWIFKVVSFFNLFIKLPPMVKMITEDPPSDRCFSSEKAKRSLGYDPKLRI